MKIGHGEKRIRGLVELVDEVSELVQNPGAFKMEEGGS